MHVFLSDEWFEAAHELRERYADRLPEPVIDVRINQVITDVPFGSGTVEAYLDTSSGSTQFVLGAVDEPDAVRLLGRLSGRVGDEVHGEHGSVDHVGGYGTGLGLRGRGLLARLGFRRWFRRRWLRRGWRQRGLVKAVHAKAAKQQSNAEDYLFI